MVRVVGIRFKKAGKIYYFDPAELPITVGCKVIVETARGIEYGDVAIGPKYVDESEVVQPLKRVIRIGTEKDAQQVAENKRKASEAFAIAVRKIASHGLEMNLVDVEYTFDGSKILFYFTAEGRVDFRELVKDLASVFRTRIEMRQIGVRDEAKLLGGIGPCGRILCCTSFLGEFAPVSIRMAKDQNLSLNPSKISGVCGRLMCCLRYEQDTYEAAKQDPTLAPGYVPPVLVEAGAEALADLEEEPARPSWKSGPLRVADGSDVSDRVARAAAVRDPAVRPAEGTAPARAAGEPDRQRGPRQERRQGDARVERPQGDARPDRRQGDTRTERAQGDARPERAGRRGGGERKGAAREPGRGQAVDQGELPRQQPSPPRLQVVPGGKAPRQPHPVPGGPPGLPGKAPQQGRTPRQGERPPQPRPGRESRPRERGARGGAGGNSSAGNQPPQA